MSFVVLVTIVGALVYLWSRVSSLESRLAAQDDVISELMRVRRQGVVPPAAGVAAVADAGMPLAEPGKERTPPAPTVVPPPKEPAAIAAAAVREPSISGAPDVKQPAVPEKPARQGLEELIGTRWAVWVGGIALGLGGILLVRYSIEAGLFGPAFRVALGALLAVGLAGAGEWLRRSRAKAVDFPGADVPAILTAAATVAALATTYSAHALYNFIDAGPAFGLLGLVGLATLGAAAMHGPALAGLGLAASFATPLLVTPAAIPNPWPVVGYLLVVAGAAYGLARVKRWIWLASAAGAGAIVWGLLLAGKADSSPLWWAPAMLHTLLQMLVAALALTVLVQEAAAEERAERDLSAIAVFAGFGLLTLAVLASNNGLSWAEVAFAGLAIAILTAVGRCRPGLTPVAVVAAAVVVAYALLWPGAVVAPTAIYALSLRDWLLPVPMLLGVYAVFMGLAAIVVAGVQAERLARKPYLEMWAATIGAGVAAILPLAVLIVANERLTHALTSIWGGAAAALVAVVFAAAAAHFQRIERIERKESGGVDGLGLAMAAFAAAAVTAAVLALLYWLERGYLTVALAALAAGTAAVADWRRIGVLRSAVGVIGVLVLGRIAWDPLITGGDVGSWPVVNWLLLGYGAPAAGFFVAARLLEREKTDGNSGVADALALLFAALLAFMEIRHALHGGAMLTAAADHAEQGLMALVAFGGSYALMQLKGLRENAVFRVGSIGLAVIATASALLALGLVNNPVLADGEPVAGNIAINSLQLGYLLPGLMAGWLAWNMRAAGRPEWLITLVGIVAAALGIGFLLLEVRFWFNGADIRYIKGAGHVEIGLMMALLIAALIGLTELASHRWTNAMAAVTLAVGGVAVLLLLAGLGLNANPLLTGEHVMGPAFVGSLAAAYLLPGASAAVLARHGRGIWPRAFVLVAGAVAVIAVFGWVSLSVRQLFQGPELIHTRVASEVEIWAYSAAWLVLGLVLLGFGMVRGVIEARAASAVFVVLTVLKVFLLDLAGLTGFWRAISFIGLGLVLIGIGLAYQRLLSGRIAEGRSAASGVAAAH